MPKASKEMNSAITRLMHGHEEFRNKYFNDPENTTYKDLVINGQSPKTMMIACSDSRVDPSILLNGSPGELFVVRNVANLVPPCDNNPKHHGTSAALEFAVQSLEVENIIVLGHSHCGGIRALLQDSMPGQTNFISSWMSIAKEARRKVLNEHLDAPYEEKERICEEISLQISYHNLLSFPWIQEKVSRGMLSLHAWRIDLNTGNIQRYNSETQGFENLL